MSNKENEKFADKLTLQRNPVTSFGKIRSRIQAD